MALLDSEEQKEEWRRDPEKYRVYRKRIEHELNVRFRFALRNSKESDEANAVSTVHVLHILLYIIMVVSPKRFLTSPSFLICSFLTRK